LKQYSDQILHVSSQEALDCGSGSYASSLGWVFLYLLDPCWLVIFQDVFALLGLVYCVHYQAVGKIEAFTDG
jgi:hypothetical protein